MYSLVVTAVVAPRHWLPALMPKRLWLLPPSAVRYLVTPPAGFQRRLGGDQFGRHAASGTWPPVPALRGGPELAHVRRALAGLQCRAAGTGNDSPAANGEPCRARAAGHPILLSRRHGSRQAAPAGRCRTAGAARRADTGDQRSLVDAARLTGELALLLQLADQLIGQAQTVAGQLLRPLLIKHFGVQLALRTVQQAGLRHRIAHAFQHHVQEQRLELPGCLRQAGVGIVAGGLLEALQPLYIRGELAAGLSTLIR